MRYFHLLTFVNKKAMSGCGYETEAGDTSLFIFPKQFFFCEFAPVVDLLWNTTPALFMTPSLKHLYLHSAPGPHKMH